jgi:hypothetical protein
MNTTTCWNTSIRRIGLLICFQSALLGQYSSAGPIAFFSTGVDAAGGLLAAGTVDPNYELFYAGTDNTYPNAIATTSTPGTWLAAGDTYQWITPTGNGNDNLPCRDCGDPPQAGFAFSDYFYSTAFDLTGFDLASVYIAFDVAADNAVNIDINNMPLGRYAGFGAFQRLELNDADLFVDGSNTIRFGVANSGSTPNPTGLMVSVVEARGVSASVDLPGSMALVLVGCLGLLRLHAKIPPFRAGRAICARLS